MRRASQVWVGFGRRTRVGGRGALWPAVLTIATAATVLVAVAFATVIAVYAGRDARESARVPVFVDAESSEASFLWRDTHDSVGLRDATVITIEPLTADAPVPPGVSEWPQPGEAVLSPALVKAGVGEGITSRYGRMVATIGPDGLASPDELLVYVRPSAEIAAPGALWPASRFGDPSVTGFIGESSDVEPLWKFLLVMSLLLGAPAGLLVVVASRAGQVERQRQALVLEMLGAGRRHRWWWAWGSIGRPWLAGVAAATVVVTWSMLRDLRLPGQDYTVQAGDMRASASVVITFALGAALLVLGTTIAAGRPRPAAGAVRPRAGLPAWPTWAAVVCFLAAPVATVAQLLARGSGSLSALVVYFTALLITLWSLPQLIGRITVGISGVLRRQARAQGDAAKLVAAGSLRHDARAVVRYAAVLAAAMIFVTQVQGYLALMSDSARESATIRAALDGRFVQITAPPGTVTGWPRVEAAVQAEPGLAVVMVVDRYDPDGRPATTLYGEPGALDAFGVDPAASTVDLGTLGGPAGIALSYAAEAGDVTIEPTSGGAVVALEEGAAEPRVSALVAAADGGRVPLAEVKQAVAQSVAPMWRVLYPGDLWFLGAQLTQSQAGWASWLGVIGVGLLAIGVLGAAADDVRRSATRVAPLAVLVSRPAVYRELVAWRLGVPMSIASAVGAVIALMLRSALTTGSGALPSTVPSVVAMVCIVALSSVALWGVTTAAIARSTDQWTGRNRP